MYVFTQEDSFIWQLKLFIERVKKDWKTTFSSQSKRNVQLLFLIFLTSKKHEDNNSED